MSLLFCPFRPPEAGTHSTDWTRLEENVSLTRAIRVTSTRGKMGSLGRAVLISSAALPLRESGVCIPMRDCDKGKKRVGMDVHIQRTYGAFEASIQVSVATKMQVLFQVLEKPWCFCNKPIWLSWLQVAGKEGDKISGEIGRAVTMREKRAIGEDQLMRLHPVSTPRALETGLQLCIYHPTYNFGGLHRAVTEFSKKGRKREREMMHTSHLHFLLCLLPHSLTGWHATVVPCVEGTHNPAILFSEPEGCTTLPGP
ncbi:hypothetical protein ACRALDRAFT_210578 [Sodiomyces alcalophilus JCM 7366]|uniref:uncharacterized protein n=1 Tax=Sodiomyces alcalophilus JCM 7366 TaxID=591952 RepID=UPI0039B3BD09